MEFNSPQKPTGSIFELLSKFSATSPDELAILGADGFEVSYRDLWQTIQKGSNYLKRQGITSDDCVAMVIPEGPSTAIVFLAISMATRCAPLNPAYTEQDFAFYLEDLKPKALVVPHDSDSPAIAAAKKEGISVLRLVDRHGFQFCTERSDAERFVESIPNPEEIALILHTSGTTSRPKMVALSHENLGASASNVARNLGLTPSDRSMNVMPLFHIHGIVAGLLSSLFSGGSVFCSPGYQADRFFKWAVQFQPTWYSAVPTIHQAILDQADLEPGLTEKTNFRLIRSSSSALPPTLFSAMESHWKVPVVESYGMTEASHQMTSNPLPPAVRKPGSVGIPAGPDVAIFDEEGRPVPNGDTGEIVIRGAGVMKSYLGNPEATASSFFGSWFRTGDKGRFDSDGYLQIVGRIKEMINRGGENIAPKEIDESLLEHHQVVQAVAFAVPHPSLGEDLAAAVVLKKNSSLTEFDLRNFLSEKLAGFKVPSRIVFLDQIPKGPTGKVQRIGLYEKLREVFATDQSAPENELERLICHEFAKILKLEKVGRNSNFFYLGGDSLKALRATAAVCDHFKIQLPPGSLFKFPNPRLFAELVESAKLQAEEIDALERELGQLTPEEIEKLLAETQSKEN